MLLVLSIIQITKVNFSSGHGTCTYLSCPNSFMHNRAMHQRGITRLSHHSPAQVLPQLSMNPNFFSGVRRLKHILTQQIKNGPSTPENFGTLVF